MANSKKKGNRFERVVAKYFTDWSGFKFGRTPGSGSFHNNRDLGSDLICNDDKHKNRCCISIECKNYQDIRFEHVLLGNKRCKIFSFWEQAQRDAKIATINAVRDVAVEYAKRRPRVVYHVHGWY